MTDRPKRDALKGSLQQLPFPKILNYLYQSSKIGILAVTRGPKKIHIHFDSGKIVAVTSTHFPGDSLGEYLIQQKQVSQEIADISFKNTRAGETRQGSYLVDKGYLTPHSLYEALNSHITIKLFKVFEWPDGDFFFKEGEIVEEKERILKIDIANLIYIGMRDYYPLQKLPPEFRGRKETPLHKRGDCPYREEDMAFGPTGTRVFSMVNGVRTLRQVVALTKLKKSVAYKILYGMFLLGFIGFPESVQSSDDKAIHQKKKLEQDRQIKAGDDKEGYEVSIGDDLIAEALKSVDKVKERVASEKAAVDGGMPAEPFEAAAPPSESIVRPQPSPPPMREPQSPAHPEPLSMPEEPAPPAFEEPESAKKEPLTMPDPFEEQAPLSLSDDAPEQKASAEQMAIPDEEEFEFEEYRGDSDAKDKGEAPSEDEALQELDELGLEASEESLWEEDEPASDDGGDAGLSMSDFGDDSGGGEVTEKKVEFDSGGSEGVSAYVKAAERHIESGNFAEAKALLDTALAQDPESAEAHIYMGWIHFNLEGSGAAAEAEKMIKKGMKFDPKIYKAFLFLGKIYAAQKQMDFAELHFIKALELNVNCNEAREEIRKIHNKS